MNDRIGTICGPNAGLVIERDAPGLIRAMTAFGGIDYVPRPAGKHKYVVDAKGPDAQVHVFPIDVWEVDAVQAAYEQDVYPELRRLLLEAWSRFRKASGGAFALDQLLAAFRRGLDNMRSRVVARDGEHFKEVAGIAFDMVVEAVTREIRNQEEFAAMGGAA